MFFQANGSIPRLHIARPPDLQSLERHGWMAPARDQASARLMTDNGEPAEGNHRIAKEIR